MRNNYKHLIWKLRLLCIIWSLTFLSIGIAFVYASLYECVNTEFDLALKTYSVGCSIIGLIASIALSINTNLLRKKYDRSGIKS
jgi:hypothetical protein